MVQNIKKFCSELHIDRLVYLEDLLHGKIEIRKPGPSEGIPSEVAVGPCRG